MNKEFSAGYRRWIVEGDNLYLFTRDGEWKFAGCRQDITQGFSELDGWMHHEVWETVREFLPEWEPSTEVQPLDETPPPDRRWRREPMNGGVRYTRREDGAVVFVSVWAGGYTSRSLDDRSFRPGANGGLYTGQKMSSCERGDEWLDWKYLRDEKERQDLARFR